MFRYLLPLLIAGLLACAEQVVGPSTRTMTVDGYVRSAEDRSALPGARVSIIYYEDFIQVAVAATQSDARGHYSVTFEGVCSPQEGIPTFHVKASSPQPGSYWFEVADLECKDGQSVDLFLNPMDL